ncbi:MAG: PQQ-binding-like beta-propeller repeat protein [Bacteroidetes bacterium]|nr:PQQ-binding-like beta-propeller repeat protein [Bacteroidota bacterium]
MKNELNQSAPAIVVHLTDKNTGQFMNVVSDQKGQMEIPVEPGHMYVIKVNRAILPDEISIPKKPGAPLTKTIIISNQDSNNEHPFDTVFQKTGSSFYKVSALEAKLTFRITDLDHRPLKNLAVRLVCPKYRRVYLSATNDLGVARFQVLLGGDYNLGIGESENIKNYQIPISSGYSLTVDIPYQPTDVTERTQNDTVFQESIKQMQATSLRAFLQVKVQDYDHLPLKDESVYLNVIGKSQVYTAKTDLQGKAYFLLPYGNDYTLHLTYERDIFLCKYPWKEGILLEDEALITYRGTAQIKDFFRGAIRDKNGFITEFMSVPVKKIGFDPVNIQPTKHGYHVNFPAKSETPTPAILNNNDVIQGGGYYSKEVYSFNNKNGRLNWGLELGDNGVSASVCDEDFLVITTESCTLYAINAKTGELAWSKWLGPEINSTPTVANGKVYAVYPTQLDPDENEVKPYAVICFDLKNGKILWQNWIDSEPLGSPVACGQSVYITTSNGNLHQFDNTSGKGQCPERNGGFTSPPTIAGNIVYLARKNQEKPEQEQIEAFQSNGLVYRGSFPSKTTNAEYETQYLKPSELMNFSTGRPLFFRGKLYAVSGNSLTCFDPGKHSSLWTIDLTKIPALQQDEFSSMPVAVNQKIMVSTRSGKVMVVDPVKGVVELTYDLETPVKFQPVVHDGWIYAGSGDGKLISYNTGNKSLTGWPMWSMNAAHNPVVE